MIAAEYVAKAKPDGYTLLLGNGSTLCINPAIHKTLSYDSVKDFAPITFANKGSPILIVSASLPVRTLSDFVAYGKSHPGEMAYGSPGTGSPQHLAGEMFSRMTGVKMTHVPYKNQAQIITDLLGGTIQATVEFAATAIPAVKTGKAIGLVVAGPKRKPALPDVPAANEVGLRDFEVVSWNGYLAPKGTPREIIATLHKGITNALRSKTYSTWAAETGVEVVASTPKEFEQILREEMRRWKSIVQDLGIVVE